MEPEEFADAQYQEKKAADRRSDDLERQLSELRGQVEPQAQSNGGKPDRSAFADDVAFIEALTDWKTDQKFAQREVEQSQIAAQTKMRSHLQRASDLVEDFDEVTATANFSVPPNILMPRLRARIAIWCRPLIISVAVTTSSASPPRPCSRRAPWSNPAPPPDDRFRA